jgi:hypothetical protein
MHRRPDSSRVRASTHFQVRPVKLRSSLVLAAMLLTLSLPSLAYAATPEPSLHPVALTAAAGTVAARISPIPVLVTSAAQTTGHVRVDNPSSLVEDVTVRVSDYSIDSAGKPVAAPADFAFGSASWYRFATPDFVLPSGTGLDVPFEIVVPVGAGAGDHFAALIVTVSAQPGQVAIAQAGPSARTVLVSQSRLQHRIDGARPETPTVNLTALANSGVVHFTAQIGNSGNTVLGHQADPTPTLTLYNVSPWADSSRAERTLAVAGFYVAPASVREVAVDWTDAPLFGRYRAVFTLPAADGQPQVIGETTVTTVNTAVLGLLGLGLLIGLVVLGLLVRHGRPRGGRVLRNGDRPDLSVPTGA